MRFILLTLSQYNPHPNSSTPVSSQFIFDYVLLFSSPTNPTPSVPNVRIDLTIIPKVWRTGGIASAFLCRPDGSDPQFPMSPAVQNYIPRQGSCTPPGQTRPAPFALIDSTYKGAHPEEAAWLDGRLNVIAPRVQAFVQQRAGRSLTLDQAKLKIAVTHSGGGKRAMLNSLGTSITLPCSLFGG